MEHRRALITILSAALIGFFAISGLLGIPSYPYEDGKLYVHVMDVGQGDAILIHTPLGKNILVDGGPHNNIREPLSDILGFGLYVIDEVFLSHPHADHMSGFLTVMQKYRVEKIWYTGIVHTTPVFQEWLQEISIQEIPIEQLTGVDVREIDGVTLEILYPDKDIQDKSDWVDGHNGLNDTSIVMRVTFGEVSFLLVGDAEEALENYLLEQYTVILEPQAIESSSEDESLDTIAPSSLQDDALKLKADVLKIGHHGSKSSTSKEFLEAVNPSVAVISSGQNNYGHPHPSVIKRLRKSNIDIFRTDTHGTITFVTDGYDIHTITEY